MGGGRLTKGSSYKVAVMGDWVVVEPPPRFADEIKKVSQNNTLSCVDMCASVFTEIPDTCMFTVYTVKTGIEQTTYRIENEYRITKNLLTTIQFSYVIQHVFGGWVVVEKNPKHYMFFMTANL